MIGGLLVLLGFELVGEVIAQLTGWPIPGPVIGMTLLFTTLLVRGRASDGLQRTARVLLSHLSLFFVPAGAGIVAYIALIRREWLPLSAALVGSTALAMAVTAVTMQALVRAKGSRR